MYMQLNSDQQSYNLVIFYESPSKGSSPEYTHVSFQVRGLSSEIIQNDTACAKSSTIKFEFQGCDTNFDVDLHNGSVNVIENTD